MAAREPVAVCCCSARCWWRFPIFRITLDSGSPDHDILCTRHGARARRIGLKPAPPVSVMLFLESGNSPSDEGYE